MTPHTHTHTPLEKSWLHPCSVGNDVAFLFLQERQAQIAFAHTEAKPPRDIRRKQARFGTGSGVYPAIPVIAPSRSVPQAYQRNFGSSNSPAKKHAGLNLIS